MPKRHNKTEQKQKAKLAGRIGDDAVARQSGVAVATVRGWRNAHKIPTAANTPKPVPADALNSSQMLLSSETHAADDPIALIVRQVDSASFLRPRTHQAMEYIHEFHYHNRCRETDGATTAEAIFHLERMRACLKDLKRHVVEDRQPLEAQEKDLYKKLRRGLTDEIEQLRSMNEAEEPAQPASEIVGTKRGPIDYSEYRWPPRGFLEDDISGYVRFLADFDASVENEDWQQARHRFLKYHALCETEGIHVADRFNASLKRLESFNQMTRYASKRPQSKEFYRAGCLFFRTEATADKFDYNYITKSELAEASA